MVQKCRYLILQFLKKRGVVFSQPTNLSYPIACLLWLNVNREILIVGTQYEFGKELHFIAVFALCLHLV